MKKVLLITGSFGNGHLQVSKNIKETFEKYYADEVEVIETDLFLQAHPNLTPVLKKLYLYSFSYFRDVYGYLYYAGKNHSNIWYCTQKVGQNIKLFWFSILNFKVSKFYYF